MRKLRCCHIKFGNTLDIAHIPAFRAAMAELHPEKSVLLHHHVSDDRLLYRYPLIQ